MTAIKYRSPDVDGLKIFYIARPGPTDAPALLLLHGFPSASHMFRDLIPLSRRSLPRRRARPAGLRPIGHAGAEQLHLHVSITSPASSNRFNGSDRLEALCDLCLRLLARRQASGSPPNIPTASAQSSSQNGNAYEEGLSEGLEPNSGLLARAVAGPNPRSAPRLPRA